MSRFGFNLNLLECKYSFDVEPFSSAVVLISTYWNVNISRGKAIHIEMCFNLNLLECKCMKWKMILCLRKRFNLNLLECKWLCFIQR